MEKMKKSIMEEWTGDSLFQDWIAEVLVSWRWGQSNRKWTMFSGDLRVQFGRVQSGEDPGKKWARRD